MTNRRDVLSGLAGVAAVGATGWRAADAAEPTRKLFAGTPFAGNALASHFERVDMALPPVPVVTAEGTAPLAQVGGKTRLIGLWAEWCVPCLIEIRDFAAQRGTVANDRFDIGLVLTASSAKLDREGALAKLRPLGAASMPLLVEPAGGKAIAEALASRALSAELRASLPKGAKAASFSLPCTLLVDARGRVRGRTFGVAMMGPGGGVVRPTLTPAQTAAMKRGERISIPVTDADKQGMMASGKTMWSSRDGKAFLQALSGGLLDRV